MVVAVGCVWWSQSRTRERPLTQTTRVHAPGAPIAESRTGNCHKAVCLSVCLSQATHNTVGLSIAVGKVGITLLRRPYDGDFL